jgi:hypothetical protein
LDDELKSLGQPKGIPKLEDTLSTANLDRARLAAIVDPSEDAIVSSTLDGILTSWNGAAQKV